MILRLTQPLTEMSNRNISWGVKAAGAQGYCHEIWEPHPPGILKADPGLYGDGFSITFIKL
jgi:hypothetical protein